MATFSYGQILTWEDAVCPGCQNATFVPLVTLKTKVGGGTTTEPGGYQCSACGQKADLAALQRYQERHRRLAELRALEAQIAQETPPAPAAPSVTDSGNRSLPS